MSAQDRVDHWRMRARLAERQVALAEKDYQHLLEWFNERVSRERHLSDRCTYLYGLAVQLGATTEQLQGRP